MKTYTTTDITALLVCMLALGIALALQWDRANTLEAMLHQAAHAAPDTVVAPVTVEAFDMQCFFLPTEAKSND